jgi:hypothetical protein
MTKETKTQRAARAAEIRSNLAAAGFFTARAAGSLVATLRACFKSGAAITAEHRNDFCAGYVAQRENPGADALTDTMLTAARAIIKAPGATSKAPVEKRRTKAQEVTYTAARKALSRALEDAGLVTNDKRGGARKPRAGESKPSTDAPDATEEANAANATVAKAEAEKRITSAGDIHAYAIQQATMLLAFIDGRKATDPVTRKNIVAFHKAMMATPAPR